NGVTLDTYREPALEANNPGLAYNHVVKEVINPGETLDWDSEAYGFDFGDMMQTVWLDHPRPQNEDPAYFVQTFDYRRVTGVNFTVVNPNNDEGGGAPEWFHNGLSNIELRIHSIRVGDCNITNILQPTTVKKHTIAPNPASGTSLVSYDAVRSGNVMVNVADMMGNTVASFNGGRSETPINVSNLTKGVYVVTVYGDGAPVSASKLVVE
ncbi:MAG: T9SS type A sorting domain-containing protein, partial [Cytophagaceae bacterium]